MPLRELDISMDNLLPTFLIRNDRLLNLMKGLAIKKNKPDKTRVLIRGISGSGKRATVLESIRRLYGQGIEIVTIPFSGDRRNPITPLVRSLKGINIPIGDYLNKDDSSWWSSNGAALIDAASKGKLWHRISDGDRVDLVLAFSLYYKGLIKYNQERSYPVFFIVDGFDPDMEAASTLYEILNTLNDFTGIRIVFIRDTNDKTESIPIIKNSKEMRFFQLPLTVLTNQLKRTTSNLDLTNDRIQKISNTCGANLYRIFHTLRLIVSGIVPNGSLEQFIYKSLDKSSRETLFIAYAASGLADKALLLGRFEEETDRKRESKCYDELLMMGLIRVDSDGKIAHCSHFIHHQIFNKRDLSETARHFGHYLFNKYSEGFPIDTLQLFLYLNKWGPTEHEISVFELIINLLLTKRRLGIAHVLLSDVGNPKKGENERIDSSAVTDAAKLRLLLLTEPRASNVIANIPPKRFGNQFLLHNAWLAYATGRWDEALEAAKSSVIYYQKLGDHDKETHAHVELAAALLIHGKVRDAVGHLSIARRIGTQVNAVWGIMRTAALESVTSFLQGNYSQCTRESLTSREIAQREGRRDIWLLLSLVIVRIKWELGLYEEVSQIAKDASCLATTYGFEAEQRVFDTWHGRGLLAQNEESGRDILESIAGKGLIRESLAFLAEHAWLHDRHSEAKQLIRQAAKEKRSRVRIQSEAEDWSDGYFPIDGRVADNDGPIDALGDRIAGMEALFWASEMGEKTIRKLDKLMTHENNTHFNPYNHHYAIWAAMAIPRELRERRKSYINLAYTELQVRAGRIDDNRTKQAWLNANPWNKKIMEEAMRMKFH